MQKLPYGMDLFKYVCLHLRALCRDGLAQGAVQDLPGVRRLRQGKPDNLIYASPGRTQLHLGILSALSAIKAEGVHVPFTGAG